MFLTAVEACKNKRRLNVRIRYYAICVCSIGGIFILFFIFFAGHKTTNLLLSLVLNLNYVLAFAFLWNRE